MYLSQCELLYGKVLKVVDVYGTVKCTIAGIFDDDADVEKLPPVYPLIRSSSHGFCKPTVGDELWVLINRANKQELYYMFRGDIKRFNGEYLETDYPDVDIISKHGDDETGTNLMMNSQDGWVMQNGKSKVQVDNDGVARLTADDEKRQINVGADNISLVSGGDAQPAVLGNELTTCLNNLVELLQKTATIAKTNPYTTNVGVAIESMLPKLNNSIGKIMSQNVVLD